MGTSITNSITDGQKKQIIRVCEDAALKAATEAVEEALLTKELAQRILSGGDKLQAKLKEVVGQFICGVSIELRQEEDKTVSDQFADEEVESSYAYPKGYKVKGITEQTNILRQLFPGIGFADEKIAEQPLPTNAEGWFAIPKWQTLAPTYGEAVEKVLAMIASKRKFYNYRDGQLGAEYLRQHAKTVKMFQKLGDEQKDFDILVVPAQFGLRHKGRSVRRAREVFAANEFGLGAFAIGIMLLTHPEREVQWEQLHVDCAGDEFAPGADGGVSDAPIFGFRDGKVEFGAYWYDDARELFGSASAFLSQ